MRGFGLSSRSKSILPRDSAMLWRGGHVSVRLSRCHKPVLYKNYHATYASNAQIPNILVF